MADRTVEEFKKVKAFRDLVAGTMQALRAARTPGDLARAIEGRVAAWEAADADFAGVLKELKGQAYSMSMPHVRAVAEKLCEHLQVNLERIEKGMKV